MRASQMTVFGVVVVGLVVAVILGARLYSASTDAGRPDANTTTDGGLALAPAPSPRPAKDAGAATRLEPLPSADQPLADSLAQLADMAARGHGGAHCRLAAEFARCGALPEHRQDFERWLAQRQEALASLTSEANRRMFSDEFEREADLRETALVAEETHCAGSPATTSGDVLNHWRRAAHAGDPAALREYATGRAFRGEELLENLDALAVYRQEAAGLAETGARNGDLSMLLALGSALSPIPSTHRSLLAQTVVPDGSRSLAMFYRAQAALVGDERLEAAVLRTDIQRRITELSDRLDPAHVEHARRLASEWTLDWSPVATGRLPERYAAQGATAVQRPEDCGSH